MPLARLSLLLILSSCAFAQLRILYPATGTLFPPDFAPPTFLWSDPAKAPAVWRLSLRFSDGAAPILLTTPGPKPPLGPIDPRAVSENNRPPVALDAHSWQPSPAVWTTIQTRARLGPTTLTIAGPGGSHSITFSTSNDPVGAPIFYRDVPLMPSETQPGVIKPLAPQAVRLIEWRLRDVSKPASRLVMQSLPVCANCHSFSADGKTLGMDLDGLRNNKGQYTLTPLTKDTRIREENVIQWRAAEGRLAGGIRVGFMSQVSPHGDTVVTTINPGSASATEPPSNYYVQNFKDYRFLQVFFPTRGLLAWYDRTVNLLKPLPGADDPRYVQFGAVWSPDGKWLVFARAEARDPNPPGAPLALSSNDPNERQIQYDLYRIPFHHGAGGAAEPIAGASSNGMSNTFPKVSPDGRWIVFVKARNGQLMRPDSELWIVPFSGGEARRLESNLAPMNSWHSFSPNGRWLVFSSKARSPYTQMYLTHLDDQGHASPAILIENSTAANRAVNLPEFINIHPDELNSIDGPAVDFFRLYDRALYLQKQRRFAEAIPVWRAAIEARPREAQAHDGLAMALRMSGANQEAAEVFEQATTLKLQEAAANRPNETGPLLALGEHLTKTRAYGPATAVLRQALQLESRSARLHDALGYALLLAGAPEARAELQLALELQPELASAYYHLAVLALRENHKQEAADYLRQALARDRTLADAYAAYAGILEENGDPAAAIEHLKRAVELRPAEPRFQLRLAALLATANDVTLRDGPRALRLAVAALPSSPPTEGQSTLAAAYAACGRFEDAAAALRRALETALPGEHPALEARLKAYAQRRLRP